MHACSFYILAWNVMSILFLSGFCESQGLSFIRRLWGINLTNSLNLEITCRLFLQVSLNFKPFDKAAFNWLYPVKSRMVYFEQIWTVVSLPLLCMLLKYACRGYNRICELGSIFHTHPIYQIWQSITSDWKQPFPWNLNRSENQHRVIDVENFSIVGALKPKLQSSEFIEMDVWGRSLFANPVT